MTTKKTREAKASEQLELADETDIVVEPQDVAIQRTADVSMIERLATDPNVDVDKFERFMAMQERIAEKQAEAEFNADFVAMQAELPEINERGRRIVKNKLHNTYAKHEDIQKVLKPILQAHGFALSYDPKVDDKGISVTAILMHRAGHSRRATFGPVPPDEGGSKNTIQEYASSESYGKRYATCAVCNITTRGVDDDGEGGSKAPEEPDGYQAFLLELEAAASEQGMAAVEKLWTAANKNKALKLCANHLVKWNLAGWERAKRTAAETTKGGA